VSDNGPASTSGTGSPSDPGAGDQPTRVLAWLKQNPEFLSDHPELLEALAPAPRFPGDRVVDLQSVFLQRLRGENERLRETMGAIIGAARDNRSAQGRIHASVLQLLAAENLEAVISAATADLPLALNVEAVSVCVEAGVSGLPVGNAAGVRLLPEGAVDHYVGAGRDSVLVPSCIGEERIYGAVAGVIRSQALVRLCVGPGIPTGLLALGARERGMFSQSQGTELIMFLAHALETIMRQWLDRAA